jgi:hypothetical protein
MAARLHQIMFLRMSKAVTSFLLVSIEYRHLAPLVIVNYPLCHSIHQGAKKEAGKLKV